MNGAAATCVVASVNAETRFRSIVIFRFRAICVARVELTFQKYNFSRYDLLTQSRTNVMNYETCMNISGY